MPAGEQWEPLSREHAAEAFARAARRGDNEAAIRALFDCSVWLSRTRSDRRLVIREYSEGIFAPVHTGRRRPTDAVSQLLDVRTYQIGFQPLVLFAADDEVGLMVDPGTDTQFILPVDRLPDVRDLYWNMVHERKEAADRRERANMMEGALRHAGSMRSRNTVRDVQGGLVQAHTIYGDVHLVSGAVQPVPDVPIFVSITYDGYRAVKLADDPPEWFPVSGDHQIKILVQGYGPCAVILHDLQAVILSRRPPRPVLAYPDMVTAGVLIPREFELRLDDPPELIALGSATFPFTVTQSDPELFVIVPRSNDEVLWRMELRWTCADSHGTLALPQEPFCLYPG